MFKDCKSLKEIDISNFKKRCKDRAFLYLMFFGTSDELKAKMEAQIFNKDNK